MFDAFLTSDYAPFSIAFVIMIGIGLIEAIGLGVGHFNMHVDTDSDVEGITILDWLGVGPDLPILIWLTSLLGCFTLAGVVGQQIATAVVGEPMHWVLASVFALSSGGVLNRFVAAGLTKIVPGYETTVISTDDLIMRRGIVLEGTARRGHPARAKVVDQYRQAHYVMLEPHNDDDIIVQGEVAMLVRRKDNIFFAMSEYHKFLNPVD
jgi:hypothetical protein